MSDAAAPLTKPPVPDDFLCFALYSATHAFHGVYRPYLEDLGLTYPQYLVMVTLWSTDDLTVSLLGEKLFLESSTLTPVLKRLEAMSLITRARDPMDERQVRVRLTDTGRVMYERAQHIPACIFEATGLPDDVLARLQTDVLALRAGLLKSKAPKKKRTLTTQA